ncbi:MAG: M48 family metalloprotease [Sphingomonadaceae bacterium]
MYRSRAMLAICAALILCMTQILAAPAAAFSILRDAETEAFLREIGEPLMKAAKLDPDSVHIMLVNDPEINAFAGGGQNVFFNSGLLIRADDLLELQGVMAHELGHVAAGHNVRFGEGAGPATNISLLSLALAGALMAMGGADAGMAVMMAGQQAATGKFLAFTRDQESRTDQAGAQFLQGAGVDGSGMIEFFRKLQGDEYRLAIKQDNAYNRTHPLNRERIAALEDVVERSPWYGKGADPALQARYQRIRGKLIGYLSDPNDTMRAYPESDTSEAARYARAYAWHKSAHQEKALAEVEAMLQRLPKDPYVLELKGQILLESGRVGDAIAPLRQATALAGGEPLIASMLGHALVQQGERDGDQEKFAEAETVLRRALAKDRDNPFAWLQLGTIYERQGDTPRAALATAERLQLTRGDPRAVLRSAQIAGNGLPKNTPEWLRAQDIALIAHDQAQQMKKRR